MTKQTPSRAARALVFAGPALALIFTIFALGTGLGACFLCGVWFWGVIWTFSSALTCALWRGFRHGDWSAFRRYEFPEDDGERFDWSTRTGRYAYLRDLEEEALHEGDQGPIT